MNSKLDTHYLCMSKYCELIVVSERNRLMVVEKDYNTQNWYSGVYKYGEVLKGLEQDSIEILKVYPNNPDIQDIMCLYPEYFI